MARFAPKLPVASAERERVTITDRDWQSIESAYGQKLSPQARRDIHEKTQKFVDRAEFEKNAEPVSDARDRINTIMGAASSLRFALDGGDHDADVYARTLIKKHLRKKGDAIKKRRRKKDDPLRGISSDIRVLIFASQDGVAMSGYALNPNLLMVLHISRKRRSWDNGRDNNRRVALWPKPSLPPMVAIGA